MNNKYSGIDLYCEGGPQFGYGHIRRTFLLKDKLDSMGIPNRIFSYEKSFGETNFNQFEVNRSNLIYVDSPLDISKVIKRANDFSLFSITFDWFGFPRPDIHFAIWQRLPRSGLQRTYHGLEYALIPEYLSNWRDKRLVDQFASPRKVLVSLGGGDLLQQGHKVASIMFHMGYQTTLVQGPFAIDRSVSEDFQVVINPTNFLELVSVSDLIITNAGGTALEALSLNKRIFILPQTDLEQEFSEILRKSPKVVGIGFDSLNEELYSKLKMESKPDSLIDTRGLSRVGEILDKLIEK